MRNQHETIGPCLSRTLLRGAAPAVFVVLASALGACQGEGPSARPESDGRTGVAPEAERHPGGRTGVAPEAGMSSLIEKGPAATAANAGSLPHVTNASCPGGWPPPPPHGPDTDAFFEMVRSTAAVNAGCLPNAQARVHIHSLGPVEVMDVEVEGLPPNTDFDFFVIQVPNAPFGLSWYQGDIETDRHGRGHQTFIGRFSIETFIVAPGSTPAPVVHDQPPFPDARTNPPTGPVHTFHLGLWFNDPNDASAAGCPGAVTPFNGEHNAGVQALSTRNFADDMGPLRQVE